MKEMFPLLALLLLPLAYIVGLVHKDEMTQMTIDSNQYTWATDVCQDRGWRTIIINHRNQLTVKCIGGGVHLYDASGRK